MYIDRTQRTVPQVPRKRKKTTQDGKETFSDSLESTLAIDSIEITSSREKKERGQDSHNPGEEKRGFGKHNLLRGLNITV